MTPTQTPRFEVMRSIVRRAALLSVVVFLGASLGACEDSPPPELARPIVFIGVDSADWTWVDPLVEEGRMPHVASLIETGTRAPLRSLEPLDKSPTIWTTIATGKRPVEHGVVGFIDLEENLAASEMRTAATFWEILGHLGWRQAVLGWWVTHPAPPVTGILVSDFLPYLDLEEMQNEDAVYPPQVWPDLEPLIVRPEDVSDELLARFVDEEIWREHGEEADELLVELRNYVAGDLTYLEMAEALYAREPFDVFSVYFRGLDLVSHSYWKYFEPHYSNLTDDDWRVRMMRSVIPEYHVFTDELIGEVLDAIHPESRVVLVSDHGFVGHRRTRRGLTTGVKMHDVDGLIVLDGPGIRTGASLEDAHVKDVMPTLLAMMGVPLAEDLDGKILRAAFDSRLQSWFERMDANVLPTYEGTVPRGGRPLEIDPATNEAVREQLRSLGYIE